MHIKTGLIGLGAMGTPMARNLAKANQLTTFWNRTNSRAEILATELCLPASGTPAELAHSCDLIITCVSADADLLEITQAILPGLKPGSVVVDTSTVSSNTAIQAAKLCAQRSVSFLDAPVSGGVEGAKKGTLAMMVGGDRQVLNQVTPILEIITDQIIHMGKTGNGQSTKAVNQLMAAGINQAVTESLAFAQTQGLDMNKLIEVISGGAAGNWFLEHRGPSMTQNNFTPGFKLKLHLKDLDICQTMAKKTGFNSAILKQTIHDYEQLVLKGFGDEDISALYRLKK